MSTTSQPTPPRVPTPLRLAGMALGPIAQRLSEWGTGIAQLLSGDLRLGVHAACQILTAQVTTTAGTGSTTITTRFTSKPAGVLLLACVDAIGGSVALPVYTWVWKTGQIGLAISQPVAVSPVTLTVLVVLG